MNAHRRRLLWAVPAVVALDGCRAADPRLTTELTYRATVPARVDAVHLDQTSLFGLRDFGLFVSPVAIKHEARLLPGFAGIVPERVHARWRYQAVGPADAPAGGPAPVEDFPWLNAEDSTGLRATMPMDDLARLARQPDRHRLRLEFIFDRATLRVRASVRQWR